ncbi:MAG TPA: hypothetical protein DCS93_19775 [Microscillaceae bacterium]|nr:hypothetical protein [Microscillaceae bacterium]
MKRIILLVLFLSWGLQSQACDICGCGLGGVYFGILPMYSTHFLGLRYSQASFKAVIDYKNNQYFEDEFSNDTYRRIDLMGRYSITKRLQVNFIVPYLMNDMDGSHQRIQSAGVGDPMVLLYYNLFNTGDNGTSFWQHSLSVGGGVKLPVGEYQKQDAGQIINRNFQIGSGSLDYLLSMNYTLRYQKFGLNAEASYKINSHNSEDYRFGNQSNMSTYLFYWITTPQVAILPFAGAYYEQAEKHFDGKIEQLNTGGSALFGTVGVQLFRKNLNLNMMYQMPWKQDFNTESTVSISANNRFTIGLVYNFSFKKKKKAKVKKPNWQ